MYVTTIELKNFKAITEVILSDLRAVNYLVGENGSGKSSILEALALAGYFARISGALDAVWWGDASRVVHEKNSLRLHYSPRRAFSDIFFEAIHDTSSVELAAQQTVYRSSGLDKYGSEAIMLHSALLDDAGDEMEYAHNFKQKTIFNRDQTDGDINAEALKKYLDENYCRPNEQVDMIYRSTGSNAAIMLRIIEKGNRNNVLRDEPLRSLAKGFDQLIRFYFSLRRTILSCLSDPRRKVAMVLIEEPETHLHPKLQKKLPVLFDELIKEFGETVQLMVSTHSPFIISEAAQTRNQKVYIMKNGGVIDLAGEPLTESKGYSSDHCLNVVSRMLGAGLADIQAQPKAFTDVQVVYCEGRKKDVNDAELYSRIFPERKWLFVSCGGAREVMNAYYTARAVVPFAFGESSTALALIDRSSSVAKGVCIGPDEFLEPTSDAKPIFTDSERSQFLESSDRREYRMLKRKEIENYLFDPAVVRYLDEHDQAQVPIIDDLDYINGEVKDVVATTPAIKKKLAALLHEHRDGDLKAIYDELHSCLADAV